MKARVVAALLASFLAAAPATAGTWAEPGRGLPQVGVGLAPAHFPNQSGADVEAMFREAASIGTAVVMLGRWDDPGFARTAEHMSDFADREGLVTIAQLDIFVTGGTRVAPPAGVSASSFAGDAGRAYAKAVEDIAARKPAYLIAATDVNRLLVGGTDRLAEFAVAYKQAYAAAKRVSPDTKVTVSFDLGIFAKIRAQGVPASEIRKLVDLFQPDLDVMAFDVLLSDTGLDPTALPADTFDLLGDLGGGRELILTAGWAGLPDAQSRFIECLPGLLKRTPPSTILWPILHDIRAGGPAASLGLYTADDREKAGAAVFRSIGRGTALASRKEPVASTTFTPQQEARRRVASDTFAIWSNTLDATAPHLLMSDPRREINHARVSPDGNAFVFTRYSRQDLAGLALEVNGYLGTEIVVCRFDAESCDVVVPAERGIVAANASWTPDGKRLLLVSNDTRSREPGLAVLDLASGALTMLKTPAGFEFADPEQVKDEIVSPGKDRGGAGRISRLFLFDAAMNGGREITDPKFPGKPPAEPPLGDHDPKLSPDDRYVAAMRHLDRDDWGIVVVDMEDGSERMLSGPHPVDAVPEWSSDGRLLIFWHVERGDLTASGLYTMRPDGTDRRRVPLPRGYFYTMPAFFPGSGSGPGARIIYSARPDPRM